MIIEIIFNKNEKDKVIKNKLIFKNKEKKNRYCLKKYFNQNILLLFTNKYSKVRKYLIKFI